MTRNKRQYPNRVQLMLSEQDAANYERIAAWLRSLGLPDNQAAVLRFGLEHGAQFIRHIVPTTITHDGMGTIIINTGVQESTPIGDEQP